MIRTNVFLSKKQRDTLKGLYASSGITASEHIRRAIDEYLARKVKGYNDAADIGTIEAESTT